MLATVTALAGTRDPGIIILMTFVVPMVITAMVLMIWARRRKRSGQKPGSE